MHMCFFDGEGEAAPAPGTAVATVAGTFSSAARAWLCDAALPPGFPGGWLLVLLLAESSGSLGLRMKSREKFAGVRPSSSVSSCDDDDPDDEVERFEGAEETPLDEDVPPFAVDVDPEGEISMGLDTAHPSTSAFIGRSAILIAPSTPFGSSGRGSEGACTAPLDPAPPSPDLKRAGIAESCLHGWILASIHALPPWLAWNRSLSSFTSEDTSDAANPCCAAAGVGPGPGCAWSGISLSWSDLLAAISQCGRSEVVIPCFFYF